MIVVTLFRNRRLLATIPDFEHIFSKLRCGRRHTRRRCSTSATDGARACNVCSGRSTALQLELVSAEASAARTAFRDNRKHFRQHHPTSFAGGGQVGVNWEWGGLVIGAEADLDWLPNTSNTITATAPGGATTGVNVNNRWLTLADACLGVCI